MIIALNQKNLFGYRTLPSPLNGGFAMDDYWIWCPSVIRGDDGHFHMFASRWPRELAFSPHWLTNSEVVRASAARPEGPYQFQEVVLPARGERYWDGMMTHNPSIRRIGETWLLFYTGSTYRGERPTAEAPLRAGDPGDLAEMRIIDERPSQSHANQRIGLATAPSVLGPWSRSDAPVLGPRKGKWDSLMVTNPAPFVGANGDMMLMYKSVRFRGDIMQLGLAGAKSWLGPYERLRDRPIMSFGADSDVEDPFVWREAGQYRAIMKDMSGRIGGEYRGGIKATSEDGIHWKISDEPRSYSRQIEWEDGTTTEQSFFERPSLLFDDLGAPTHLFAATATGSSNIGFVDHSRNIIIPLVS